MIQAFVTASIERFGDTAMVSVALIHEDATGELAREQLEHYETLSAGATNSARRECRKHAERLNVRWCA